MMAAAAHHGGGIGAWGITGIVVVVVVLLVIWLLPVLIAWRRKAKRLASIAVVDVLLGWTLVGWVAALAWALGDNTREPARGETARAGWPAE